MLSDSDQYDLPPEAVLAIQSGRKSDAVEIVREQMGVSHGEAQIRVQRAAQQIPSQVPRSAGGQEDSGVVRLIVILAALAAVVAAIFLL
ncbi:MAG: hypothetical protein ACNA7W_07105 [Pseudomonadales bacterium]